MKHFYSRDVEASADSVEERNRLLLELKGGDILVVPSVDHLFHRWPDLKTALASFEERGVILAPRWTSRQPGEPLEVAYKRALKRAATERAKRRGAYTVGRPRKADVTLARKLKDDGISLEMIAGTLGVHPATIRRYLAQPAASSA